MAHNVTLDCLALVDWIWVGPPLRRDPQLQNHNDLSDTPRRLSIVDGDRQADIIAIPGISGSPLLHKLSEHFPALQ